MNGRCQHTHTHHHPPHPLNQPCSRTMIPLPPSLPPSPPLPSPFCSALNRCEPSEASKTAPWSSLCSSTRVHKELVWSSVERMQGLHSPVERKQCGQGTMQKVSTTPPTHPPTHPYCLPPSPACSKGRPSCAVPWVRVPAPQPEKSSWPVCTPRTAWWSSSPQLSKRCCHQGQISTLQTTSPAMRQKTARGYKLTMALLPSSAWLG